MRNGTNIQMPTVPVTSFSLGLWRVSLGREALSLDTLQTSHDDVANKWSHMTTRLRYLRLSKPKNSRAIYCRMNFEFDDAF